MNAVMNRPHRVDTETHVERQFIETCDVGSIYEFRLVWEGTVIASTRVVQRFGAPGESIDDFGIASLLRAATAA